MTRLSRITIVVATILLAANYIFPLWEIGLEAPQYPEGLGLTISIDKIGGQNQGDLNKINNLNHYIGMKRIEPDSIKELKIMPWIMRFLMLFGLVVAFSGSRRLMTVWLLLFVVIALAGLVDYYMWGYDYGHNLDEENAIIKIPGMTYQPPLIGTKKLLNFNASSWPGLGGWFTILSFAMAATVWYFERRRTKR